MYRVKPARRHNRATRLDHHIREREIQLLRLLARRRRYQLHILAVGFGMILGGIANTKAAAHIQFGQNDAGFILDLPHKGEHHLGGMDKGLFVKNLRADVAMQTLQFQSRQRQRLAHSFQRIAVFQRKAEFGIDLPGADKAVGGAHQCRG